MNHRLLTGVVTLALGAATNAAAESIYVVARPDRAPLFTNRAALSQRGSVFRVKDGRRFQRLGGGSSAKLFPNCFSAEIAAAAREHQVDPALVRAVIHAESSFNPRAVSPKGAKGLMQLMPSPARSLGVDDPFEPGDNIRGGTNLLADLKRKFKGDVRLALAAYNAGEGAVRRHNGIPPYRETQDYVAKVLRLRAAYSGVRSVGAVTAG